MLFLVIDFLKKGRLTADSLFFFYQYLVGMGLWVLLTFPAYFLFTKTARFSLGKRIGLLFLLGIGLGVLKNLLSWTSFLIALVVSDSMPFSWSAIGNYYQSLKSFYFMEAIIIAWVILAVFYVIELYQGYKVKSEEAAMLEVALTKAQLSSLKMQLQPHFLFNAHNTVSMLIRNAQYEKATTMISKISDLLRKSLQQPDQPWVRVAEEFSTLQDYLEIEQVRFEDQLEVQLVIDEATKDCKVPNLILQPLVENAFKHGIAKHLGKACLKVEANIKDQNIELLVYNSGPQLPHGFHLDKVGGIGLKNTVERLEKLYGQAKATFDLFNAGNGVTARIQLPTDTST